MFEINKFDLLYEEIMPLDITSLRSVSVSPFVHRLCFYKYTQNLPNRSAAFQPLSCSLIILSTLLPS